MSQDSNDGSSNTDLQIILASEELPTRKKIRKRPDGTDVERYAGREKWLYRRWAWAFLRRNEHFQAACKVADASGRAEDKDRVAVEYGLKRYKSYREGYIGEGGKPLFSAGSITSWSHLDCENDGSKRVRVTLNGGQILIRFDVASALNDVQILEKQIRLADSRLKNRLKRIEVQFKKEAKIRRNKVSTFGHYLRLLDLRAAGKTLVESGKIISQRNADNLANDRHDLTKEDLASQTSKQESRAIEYATELYRYLAVLKGRPYVKSIPLD